MGTRSIHLLRAILVACVACGLAGCGDDDNPTANNPYGTGLVGTWVRYAALDDGVPDPSGGAYGTAGHMLTVRGDGTGEALDPVDVGPPAHVHPFTWTRDGDVLTVTINPGTPEEETFSVDVSVTGDTLTLVEPGNYTGIYQRYLGAGMLFGTWEIVSVIDDEGGGPQPVDPGAFAWRFSGDGTFVRLEDGAPVQTLSYTTDGPVLAVADDHGIFAVVGTELYVFRSYADQAGDHTLIYRFDRI